MTSFPRDLPPGVIGALPKVFLEFIPPEDMEVKVVQSGNPLYI